METGTQSPAMANVFVLPTRNEDAAGLLASIAGGSEAALAEFYRLYQSRIYSFIIGRVHNAADAADVLNEVMMEVWRHAAAFQGRSRVLTWVLGIAHHKSIDCLRRRSPHLELEDGVEEKMEDECDGAPEILAKQQDATLLRFCVEKLSGSHRAVVHLAFFQELSYAEVATILACPEGTVKTRMFHAKQKLKDCLMHANAG
jgi:RNA polymerase sigma-70 factor (ECF subfamily)